MSATTTHPDDPELRSVDEAAAFLDVHRHTVLRMLRRGELRGYRIGSRVKVDMKQVRALASPTPPEQLGVYGR
jgi:excisionase family DNA binding protein